LKATELRRKGIRTEVDFLGRSIKSQMREANRQQAHYVMVVGEQELITKTAKLKNMRTGEETSISLDDIKIPS
jgi:histidyl-tRNA synthetase